MSCHDIDQQNYTKIENFVDAVSKSGSELTKTGTSPDLQRTPKHTKSQSPFLTVSGRNIQDSSSYRY